MQPLMAYLLGMYYGNGKISKDNTQTTVFIEVPYKTLVVDDKDISVYVSASINKLKTSLQPLLGIALNDESQNNKAIIYFTMDNGNFIIKEFLSHINNTVSCEHIELSDKIKAFGQDYKLLFLRGFADVTGYIRDSNKAFVSKETPGNHRVYLEIPKNWQLVIDIANLLLDVGVPIQTIDWAHPNIRNGNLTKYNQGKEMFWKKEHQIKIWAHEFNKVGFTMKHKNEKLITTSKENNEVMSKKTLETSKKFYWQKSLRKTKERKPHPKIDDEFIPEKIRGKHFDSWAELAKELGYPPETYLNKLSDDEDNRE